MKRTVTCPCGGRYHAGRQEEIEDLAERVPGLREALRDDPYVIHVRDFAWHMPLDEALARVVVALSVSNRAILSQLLDQARKRAPEWGSLGDEVAKEKKAEEVG